MKQLLFAGWSLVALACPAFTQAQDIRDTARLQQTLKMDIAPGQTKLVLPQPFEGYRILLKGTDRHPVIDTNGLITRPLNDAVVQLYLVLQKQADGSVQELPNIAVTVPGKPERKGNPKPFVIPSLREWNGGEGTWVLTKKSRIVIDPSSPQALLKAAVILQKDINTLGTKPAIVTGKPSAGDIFLTLHCTDPSLEKEGYLFDVKDHINISANAYEGLFAGTRTLMQLLAQGNIPRGLARDYPKYEVRGFVLDAGRKYFSMDFLRTYVQFMSYYKMNDFHVHLNDNAFKQFFGGNWDSTYSAFRLENATYPGLTAKDGSYGKKEFIELQQMAKDYGIRIIPEIDVPAHSLAFTKAVPQIGSRDYGKDHLELHDSLTYRVIENVFKEYLQGPNPVFIGDEVHIGTDEYAKKEAEPFRRFTDHFIRYVESYGKKVRFWGSLTHAKGTTPVRNTGVTINAWYNGYADPKEMISEGYDIISTPDGWLYIVPAAGYYYDYLNTKMLYGKWEPNRVGNQVFAFGHPKIRGGSFAVWNDHYGNGITAYDVHHRVFPAMQTLAEKMWAGTDGNVPYDSFMVKGTKLLTAPGILMGVLPHDLRYPFLTADGIVSKQNVTLKDKALNLQGASSYVTLPYEEVGYNYTVEFDIKPAGQQKPGAVLFSSEHATVKVIQEGTDKLGFSREGYNYNFNYSVPPDVWTHIRISGDKKGTTLYVNGTLQDDLRGHFHTFPNPKDKMAKVETLLFPLRYVGSKTNAFKGAIRNLQVKIDQ